MSDRREQRHILDADGRRIVLTKWQRCHKCGTISKRASDTVDEGDFCQRTHKCKACGVTWFVLID